MRKKLHRNNILHKYNCLWKNKRPLEDFAHVTNKWNAKSYEEETALFKMLSNSLQECGVGKDIKERFYLWDDNTVLNLHFGKIHTFCSENVKVP